MIQEADIDRNDLPSISTARLPDTYKAAKRALAECFRIDECQEWADKAKALASYAKQAKDDKLRKMAMRIQARAIRRCGELLKAFDGRGGDRTKSNGGGTSAPSQRDAAEEAGLSKRQQVTAVNVANVSDEDFNAIDLGDPPTVTELADIGKKSRPLVDLGGIDPGEYALSTDGQDQIRRLAEFANRVDAGVVARGAKAHERKKLRQHVSIIDAWLDRLITQLEE